MTLLSLADLLRRRSWPALCACKLPEYYFLHCGPGSSVGTATGYGLDGPGIESRWGARFSAPVQTGLAAHPTSYTMGTGSFPGGKERPGRDADPSPPSSAAGHERVEPYLYSTYRPYGLYRASVPVQGCTLPLHYRIRQSQVSVELPPDHS